MEFISILIVLVAAGVMRHFWPEQRRPPPRVQPRLPDELPVAVRRATRRAIADARTGELVAVIGRVLAPTGLVAPVSWRACVAYDVVVHEAASATRIARAVRAETFEIDDGSGRAVVEGRGAYVRLVFDHVVDRIARDELAEPALIAMASPAWHLIADEGALTVGARVLVVGVVHRVDEGPAPSYRRSADARIRLAAGGDRSAMVSNRPEDLAPFE